MIIIRNGYVMRKKAVLIICYLALSIFVMLLISTRAQAAASNITADGCIEITTNAASLNVGDKVEVKLFCREKSFLSFTAYVRYDKDVFKELQTNDIKTKNFTTDEGYSINWDRDSGINQHDTHYDWLYLGFNSDGPIGEPIKLQDDGYLASLTFEVKKAIEETTISMTNIVLTVEDYECEFYGDLDANEWEMISTTVRNQNYEIDTEKFKLSSDSASGAAGSNITVPLKITENPGVNAFGVTLTYDQDICDYDSLSITDAYADKFTLNEIYKVPDQGIIRASFVAKDNVSDLGTFANLSLKLKEGIAEGTTSNVTADIVQVTNREETAVTGAGTSAVITVTGQSQGGEDAFTLGDVNGDGSIDLTDAVYVLLAFNEEKTLTNVQKKAGDVDHDGAITLTDARHILKYYNGEFTAF